MLRKTTLKAIAALFTLVFFSLFAPIVPNFNKDKKRNAPEMSSSTTARPYKIPRSELKQPASFDDYSFKRDDRDDLFTRADVERIDRLLKKERELKKLVREYELRSMLSEQKMKRFDA